MVSTLSSAHSAIPRKAFPGAPVVFGNLFIFIAFNHETCTFQNTLKYPTKNRDSVVRHLRATGEADAVWMNDQMEKRHED